MQVPSAEAGQALTLDRTAGVEHIYFVCAAARWVALESALALSGSADMANHARGAHRPAVTEPNDLGLRGVGGMAVLPSHADVGFLLSADGRQFNAAGGMDAAGDGDLLVVERWFHHVR